MNPVELLDRALLSERGLRLSTDSAKEAIALRFRLYRAIKRDRERNMAAGHGDGSEWDSLKITVVGNDVIITHHAAPRITEL